MGLLQMRDREVYKCFASPNVRTPGRERVMLHVGAEMYEMVTR